jgi:predicted DNA-binding transcriptional regulator YafY
MATNLHVERRTVYRYIADLSNEVVVDNGFIYLRHLAMAA